MVAAVGKFMAGLEDVWRRSVVEELGFAFCLPTSPDGVAGYARIKWSPGLLVERLICDHVQSYHI